MSLAKQIRGIVRIVYIDRRNRITERKIEIIEVKGNYMRAFCFTSKGPRVFTLTNVLAYEVVKNDAG